MASTDYDTSLAVAESSSISFDSKTVAGLAGSGSHDTSTINNARLSLIYKGEQITFERGPRRPSRVLKRFQPEASSAGAVDLIGDAHAGDDVFRLEFVGMAAADYQALNSFFFDVVEGMGASFIWADVNSVPHTVRFAEPTLQTVQITGGRYNVSLSLRVVA